MGFRCLVRDQEVDGSNPFAPTISFRTNNLQAHELWLIAWCWSRRSIVQVLSLRPLQISIFHWFTLHSLFRQQRRFVYQCGPTAAVCRKPRARRLCPGSAVDVARVLDPTITEKSFRNFCRQYGAMINYDFLNRETREWLQSSMDLVRNAVSPRPAA